jgi:hypothetical protein
MRVHREEHRLLVVERPLPVRDDLAAIVLAAVLAGYAVTVPEGTIRLEPEAPPGRRLASRSRR